MQYHTVSSYDKDLKKVSASIIEMGELVIKMLDFAHKSIKKQSEDVKVSAIETDRQINEYDHKIETMAIHLIALRQPMAIDLRQLIAALKIAVILERMGDLAKHITKRIKNLPQVLDKDYLSKIDKMHEILTSMLSNALRAYETNDDILAGKVIQQDLFVDTLYSELLNTATNNIEKAKKGETEELLQIIFALKNFERIGDYIAKLANIIHFIISGETKFFNPD